MTKRAIVWGVAIGALLPAGSIGCVGGGESTPQTASGETYAISVMASTRASLPPCTANLVGTVAYVTSPPSVYACESPRSGSFSWTQIACSSANFGSVAYANFSPPLLLDCTNKGWTPIALPQGEAGPPGPRGPAGPSGEAGAPALISTTQLPAGDPDCPTGGVRIDTTSNGVRQAPVYVCKGGEEGDATVGDGGGDGPTIPPGLLAYPSQHAQALCEGIGKCCPQYDGGAFDLAACEAASLTSGWDNTTLPTRISVYDAGHLTFNAMQAKVCVTALQGFTCTGSGQYAADQYAAITNSCLGVLGGTIPIGTGGCTSSWECASGAWCNLAVGAGAGAGFCAALLPIGAPCTLDEMCSYVGTQKPATYCDLLGGDGGVSTAGQCQPARADNVPCGDLNQGIYFDDQACSSQLCGDDFTCGTAVTIPTPMNFCTGYPYPDAGGD